MQNIKNGIEGHPVEWYRDVFDIVFPNLDREKANTCKIEGWSKEKGDKKSGDEE